MGIYFMVLARLPFTREITNYIGSLQVCNNRRISQLFVKFADK